MENDTPQVAVILLTMNQRDKTLRCLQSFSAVNTPHYRILVLDNGSDDGTCEAIREKYPDVLLEYQSTNLGVAGGRNLAARIAIQKWQAPFLFFLDNDMTVTAGFLAELVAPFAKDELVAQSMGKILCHGEENRLYGAGGCRVSFTLGQTGHIGHGEIDTGQYDSGNGGVPSGGCMLVRTAVWEQLDGFDPVYSPYGPEDLDFGLRVRQAGYRVCYVPAAVVYHDPVPGRTLTGPGYSETYARSKARMWLLFMRRRASVLQWCAFLLIGVPVTVLRVVVREGRRGNLVALRGLITGAFGFLRSSNGSGHSDATEAGVRQETDQTGIPCRIDHVEDDN